MEILEKNVCVEHQFEGYRVGYRVGKREFDKNHKFSYEKNEHFMSMLGKDFLLNFPNLV